jgi:hypothetical protein
MNNLNNFSNGRKDASIMLIKQCPLCSKKYSPENMEILEEEGYAFLAYLSCGNCSSHLIIRVIASPHGLVGTASITDLQASEVLTFREERAIRANEVLDLIEIIDKGNLLESLTI